MSDSGAIPLQPLSTGKLFDRAITMYREHFLTFTIIMVPPSLCWVALAVVGETGVFVPANAERGAPGDPMLAATASSLGFMVYWVLLTLAQGATTVAVSELHQGCAPDILELCSRLKGLLLRLFGLGLVLGLATLIGLLLCTLPGVWVLMRTALSVPAAVAEDLEITPAVVRSYELTRGSWVRVLLVYALEMALGYTAVAIFAYPFGFAATAVGVETPTGTLLEVLSVAGAAIAGASVGSIGAIALTLIYYDERVRKEGLDLVLMMAKLDAGTPPEEGASPGSARPPAS